MSEDKLWAVAEIKAFYHAMCAFLRVIFKTFFNGSGNLEQDSATKIIVYTNWFYGVKPTDKQDGDTPGDTMIAFRQVKLNVVTLVSRITLRQFTRQV